MAQIKKKFIGANQVDETKILLNNDENLRARNAADDGDIEILKVNAADRIEFASVPKAAAAPVAGDDLTNKDYVDGEISPVSGDVASLVVLSGVAAGEEDLGIFTGAIIPDDSTVKGALQSLETATEGAQSDADDALAAAAAVAEDVSHLVTLSGVAVDSDDLGTFTGTTIPDSSTIKGALQSLETSVELKADSSVVSEIDQNVNDLITLSGVAENATSLGTFTGEIIPDSSNVKAAFQSLETYIEALPDPFFYAGTYNATTDSPALDNTDTDKNGYVYYVTVAGSQDFGAGSISFEVGDKVVNNGTTWDKWDMTDAVASVNGQTGAVVLELDDLDDVDAAAPNDGDVLTFDSGSGDWIASPTAATLTVVEEILTLSGGDITAQFKDLSHPAQGSSASVNSISLSVVGGPVQLKVVDYTVSLTGGAGGNSRITFAGDLATAGAAALIAGDILMIQYSY